MLFSTKKIIPRSILKSIKVCESSQLSRDTLRLNHQNLYFHIRTTSYLLLITAMNKYGWSDQSKIFKFRTLSSGTNIQLEYNYIVIIAIHKSLNSQKKCLKISIGDNLVNYEKVHKIACNFCLIFSIFADYSHFTPTSIFGKK